MHKILKLILAAGVATTMMACSTHSLHPVTVAQEQESAMKLAAVVPGLKKPRSNLITGGQPTSEAWALLKDQGVTRVVNLRTADELGGRDEGAEIAAQGLDYRQIEIAGGADINAMHADQLWKLLDESQGTSLVHCASGNRAGALLALGAWRQGGMTPQQALDFGKSAGLGSLEPKVRELLGLPPAQ